MNQLSKAKILMLGFQHVCVMYGGAVAVPLMIGPAIGLTPEEIVYLIAFDLFACGIATCIQVIGGFGFGIKLPALMATSFIVVEPIIAIGKEYGITGVLGSVAVSGLIIALAAPLIGRLSIFFPPVVTGSIILIIGASLMPVAMKNAAGGEGSASFGDPTNLLLAAITLVSFLVLNVLLKGFMKAIALLLALVIGSVVGNFFGLVSSEAVANASWFSMVQPFHFGTPTFQVSSIITMSIISLIVAIESIGVFIALGEICKQDVDRKAITKGIRAEGLGSMLSGIFNSFNHSTFSQNVGLVMLTRVTDRAVVICAGVILLILGLVPKVSAITTMIPTPVLGGAMIPMFGMLMVAALQMLVKADMTKPSNQLIVAVGVGIGLAIKGSHGVFDALPETARLLVGNGVVMGTFTLLILNLVLNGKPSKDDANAHHHGHAETKAS
ncbi:nucleobase:cation symporter-2 family protein [Metabacillus fastidiosus]|uniref:nucleobase:cation symporter-2 family protein n=1 Tax=Metabacillus fastidiosus TaxID=1458 RepID=UPI003D288590